MAKAIHQVVFSRLNIGEHFYQNGNHCVKRSSRTADLVDWDRWFYFGQKEWVTVDESIRNRILTREAQG